MGILIIWPLLVAGAVWLYHRHLQREVQRRNERITRAYIDAAEQGMQLQRELYEASK